MSTHSRKPLTPEQKERRNAANRAWAKANPDKVKVYHAKRALTPEQKKKHNAPRDARRAAARAIRDKERDKKLMETPQMRIRAALIQEERTRRNIEALEDIP